MKTTRIIIFAKAPIPGRAKTRLIPALGVAGAERLARQMLASTLDAALAAGVGPVELCAAPAIHTPAWRDIPLPRAVETSAQGPGDLGARMGVAAARTIARGESVLLIGTDIPALDAGALRRAAQRLQGVDATLLPVVDGGYCLLGLRRFDRRVFEAIPWGTASVGALTRSRMAGLGWRVDVGPTLRDIDTPADLQWLPPGWCAWLGAEADRRPGQQERIVVEG